MGKDTDSRELHIYARPRRIHNLEEVSHGLVAVDHRCLVHKPVDCHAAEHDAQVIDHTLVADRIRVLAPFEEAFLGGTEPSNPDLESHNAWLDQRLRLLALLYSKFSSF